MKNSKTKFLIIVAIAVMLVFGISYVFLQVSGAQQEGIVKIEPEVPSVVVTKPSPPKILIHEDSDVPLYYGPTLATGDDCTDPIVVNLPGDLPYSDLSQTTCGRNNDYDATCLGYYDGGEDIIYELTVSSAVVVDITMNPKGTTYTGLCIDNVCPPGDPCMEYSTGSSGSRILTGVSLAPGIYYIMIDTWPSPTCIPDFDLTIVEAAPPPPNDDCTNAEAVGDVTGYPWSTTQATFDGNGTCMSSPNIWYCYTATCDGDVTVSLCGSGFDTKLAVYETCECDPLGAEIECNDDCCGTQSQITFAAVIGNDYLIEVGGYGSSTGNGLLSISCHTPGPPPANDDCENAIAISPAECPAVTTVYGTTKDATIDCPDVLGWEAVWYVFELSYSCNNVLIDYCPTNDPRVWTRGVILYADECPVTTEDCNDYILYSGFSWVTCPSGYTDLTLWWNGLPAGTYYLPVYVVDCDTNQMDFGFDICVAECPPGTNCDLPIAVSLPAALPYSDLGQTTCGKGDFYDETCLGSYDGGEDIIYEINVTSAIIDVVVTLDPKTCTYTGIALDDSCPPNSDCIATSTNYSASPHGFTIDRLEAGTYYLMIDTYPSPDCIPEFDLTITGQLPPPDDMATISIDNPSDGANLEGNSAVSVQATVKNMGTNTQSTVPVHLEITNEDLTYTYTDVEYTGTLNASDTELITFDPDWTVPNVLAGYTIKVWTALSGDGNPNNDTVTISVSAMPEGYTCESFEDLPFPPPGWDMGPGTDDWARTSYSAHTGSYKARARGQNAWLFTPPLKVESGDRLGFWYRAESSSHPTSFYVRLSTSPDQTDTLGYTTILADYQNITSTTYLEGNIDLSGYKGIVYVAFHRYYCDVDYYYLYLDDVALPPFPIQIVVSPDSFYVQSFPDTSFDEYLYIGNLGGGQLDYDIELETTVGWLSVAPTSGSALGGEEDTITLSFNTAGLDGHYYNTLRIISNSDMKGVDTVLVPVHLYVALIPEISVSPDSFAVGVEGNGTLDTSMFISNTGNGDLEYTIETEEWTRFGDTYLGQPAYATHGEAYKSKIIPEEGDEREEQKGWEDPRRGVPPARGMGGPDAFGYRWIDSDEPGGPTYDWVEISGVGTQLTMGDDDNQGPFPIGFTFNFYGNDFTELYICSNGWVSFTSTVTTYGNDTIPDPTGPQNLLALFWDDLTGSGGNVYYYNDGSRFIIQYDEVHRLGCAECLYTMEIILYPNGKIIYQYHTMGGDRLDEATIGIENEDGTDGLEVVFNAEYVHDELAIRFSSAPAWLVFSPESGTVPPDETDTIDVTFDATGILTGEFSGAFIISSNDPASPLDTVPAHMTILVPDMTFDPDSIVASCIEGQDVQPQTMNIGNAGDGTLTFNIVEGAPWLSVSPDAGTVAPGDPDAAIDLTIDCTDLYAGNYMAELEVYSNDPDLQPYAIYEVYLHVGPDPDIDVSPDSFYIGLYAGLSKDTTMTIANEGDGHLVWGIAIEELSPPKSPDTLLWEDFEDEWPPSGWSDPGDWQQECMYYAHTGLCGAYLAWGYGLDEWLITPSLTLGAGSYLKFWWESSFTWSVDPYDNADLFVKISTNGGSSWETLWTFGDSADVVNSGGPWPWGQFEWAEATLDLSAYTGNALIAFNVVADDNADIAIDDVVVESFGPPWLSISEESGVLDPHSSTDITVSFSSIGVSEDKYANMWVTSNDPDEDPVLVPVHLEILGPEYSISPPETLVIEATEDAYTDGHLFVSNFGGHAPLIFKMTDPVAWLSESPDSADVPIDGTQDVTVTVDGYQLIAGDYETYIAIETNDFDEGYDTIVVIVHVGPDPCIAVDPESFDVQVSAGGTKDTTLTITNDCDGHLAFEVSFEETGGPLLIGAPGGTYQDRILDGVQNRNAEGLYKSAVTGTGGARLIDKSNPAHLTALELGSPGMGGSLPGSPVMGKGDTVFIQLPHDPDESWSFGTSDQGAGYKLCENFWGVTLPISDIHFWGLCLIYSAGWFPGDPNNLVFDITFYSDPPGEIEPPTEVACTYQDVVPTVVPTGLFYTTSAGTFEMYFFEGVELSPLCNLSEGWVSIESKSAGEGYDWLLWASAKTGDGLSCQVGEGADCPRYYDQALILGGGVTWLTVSPEADTVDPQSSYMLDVHFDATEILGGEKFGNIIIDHNAPDKGTTIVPVHMAIGGAYYAIDPEELHMEVLEDWVADSTLKVSNPDGEAALSYKMTCPVAWLTINPDTADVDPDQELSVSVRVNGTMLIAGDYYTEIAVKTNAVNQQHDTIPVFVHVGPDPDIDVVPMSLKVSVIPGCSMEKSVKMSNLGLGHLGFETSIGQTPPILAAGENNVRDALEALRQAGKADPSLTPEEAYKVIGAERSTVEYVSTGTSEGVLLTSGKGVQADILLVDDDGGTPGGTYTDIEYAYLDALDAGGYVYDYYNVDWTDPLSDGPDLSTMQSYSVVIWFTGETWGYYGYDVLTLNDETNLAAYLDGGGNLFLSAQDYLYASYPSAGSFSPGQFPYDYLHLSSVSQDALMDPYTAVGGVGSVAEGMQFETLRCYDNPDVPLWTDFLFGQAKAVDVFSVPGGISAVQYDAGDFKTVFTTTEFCGLVDGSPSTRAELMASIMDWMLGAGCPFSVTPESGIVDPQMDEVLFLTFDGDAFPQCEDGVPPETLTCYLSISSNDPDEPVVSVEVDMWSGRGDVMDPTCLIQLGDVVFLINFVYRDGPAPDPLCMGDCNPPNDGMVDIEDVMYLIQYLFEGGMPPLAVPTSTPTPMERK